MMRNIFVLVIATLTLSHAAFAAEVTKVKGSNALVELKGEAAAPGDIFFTIGADGKRHGILQITKVKGEKAIGKITKGKADIGQTLERKGSAPTKARRSRRGGDSSMEVASGRSYWGGMLGYGMDKMTVQVNSSTQTGKVLGSAALSGNSFSAMGFFDYEMFPQIWFRGLAGLEGFSVSGTSMCGSQNTSACNASIYYISMDGMARYLFMNGNLRPWLGLGIALMFPATKSATALDASSISNTTVIQVAGGVDWFFRPNMFIPVSLEYGMLPKSNEVEASWIALRVGLGIPF